MPGTMSGTGDAQKSRIGPGVLSGTEAGQDRLQEETGGSIGNPGECFEDQSAPHPSQPPGMRVRMHQTKTGR